jgi:hypothetical protein
MVPMLRFVAKALWFVAATAVAVGFVAIIINGSWPDAMKPVQHLFRNLHEYLGPFAFLVQVAIFAGPGALVWWLADALEDRKARNSN